MGAGQIGGIATLMDIDFENAAGFIGAPADITEGQFMLYFLSQSLLFCTGALIEPHVVLTAASCVFGERYKFEIFAGTHKFLENTGASRVVNNMCLHKGYNHSHRWTQCVTDNLALLVLNQQYSFAEKENRQDYVLKRLRYGAPTTMTEDGPVAFSNKCRFYGWGSRRNGYVIPLLIDMYRVDVDILPSEQCDEMWHPDNKYLCLYQPPCRSDKYGALCPDDLGSVLVCEGYARGIMVSLLVDRPCGTGFLDLSQYNKFLRCGVDDAREVLEFEPHLDLELPREDSTPIVATADHSIAEVTEGGIET